MDFKVHDRVRVKPLPDMDSSFHSQEGVVIGSSEFGDSTILVKMDNPKLASMRPDKAWVFIAPSRQLDLLSSQPTIKEQPCQTCKRVNDSSATACWWCGNKPW